MGKTSIPERVVGKNDSLINNNEDRIYKHKQRQGSGNLWFSDYGEMPKGWWFTDSESQSYPDPFKFGEFLKILKRMITREVKKEEKGEVKEGKNGDALSA